MFTEQELKTLEEFITLLKAHDSAEVHEQLLNFMSATELHAICNTPVMTRWTANEDNIIRAMYKTHGCEIPELMCKRTQAAIRRRAHILGVSRDTYSSWSTKDIALLQKCYSTHGVDIPELQHKFTDAAICAKATSLKIDGPIRKRFTYGELAILKSNYPKYGSDIPELKKRHTAASIRVKASKMGLRYDSSIFKYEQERNSRYGRV